VAGAAWLSRRMRLVVVTVHVAVTTAWTALLIATVALQAASQHRTDIVMNDDLIRWRVLVPLVVVTVVTGVILASGTPWGFTRYRWMVAKLYLVAILLGFGGELFALRSQVLWARIFILTLLIIIAAISTGKPGGRTRQAGARTPARR